MKVERTTLRPFRVDYDATNWPRTITTNDLAEPFTISSTAWSTVRLTIYRPLRSGRYQRRHERNVAIFDGTPISFQKRAQRRAARMTRRTTR